MLSLILLLVLVGIAAYFRSPAWLISLAAVVGLALGGASWWAYIPVLVIAAACCLPPARPEAMAARRWRGAQAATCHSRDRGYSGLILRSLMSRTQRASSLPM